MSLTPEEMRLHRLLLKEIDKYIQLNLQWEEKRLITAGRKSRKVLRNVLNIAYLRWQELGISMQKLQKEKNMYTGEINETLKEPGIGLIKTLSVSKNNALKNKKGKDSST